jgi:HAD superfamily hydrolase (TIGR01509 family)
LAITTILSDLGNVVVHFDNNKMYQAFARLSGKMPQEIEQILFGRKPDGSYLVARYSSGQMSTKQFHCCFLHQLGLCGSIAAHQAFLTAFCDVFTPNQPVVDLWRRLRAGGLTLTAVTNVEELRYRWLCRMGIMDLFDHELLSFEEGLLKPSEEFMVRALDRSGAKAEETIFVDDIDANLAPAAKLGIHTHLYRDLAGLVSFLAAFGLAVP